MKIQVYSVYDSVAELYSQPFYSHSNLTAQRLLQNAVNAEGHNYNANPEDYTLFNLGEFDDNTGVSTSKITKVLDLITLKKSDQPLPQQVDNSLDQIQITKQAN